MKTSKTLTAMLVAICLVFGSVPAFAHAPVLPDAEMLSEEELEGIQGQGPATGLLAGAVGFIGGGVTGAVGYAVDYAWEKYVAKSDPVFDGSELAKQVWTGAIGGGVGGYIGGLLTPAP